MKPFEKRVSSNEIFFSKGFQSLISLNVLCRKLLMYFFQCEQEELDKMQKKLEDIQNQINVIMQSGKNDDCNETVEKFKRQ